MADKSNEILATPALLNMLVIEGAVVTIDAMGCQRGIARTIRDKKADYIPALKGNQGSLHADFELFVSEQKARDFADTMITRDTTIYDDHGRVMPRSTRGKVCNEMIVDLAWLTRAPAQVVHHAGRTNPPRMESQMTTITTKTNDAALAAFMRSKAEVDALLARITAASADHFGATPDRVTWGDAGSLGFVTERLKEITEFLRV
jgi:hypothetical protein